MKSKYPSDWTAQDKRRFRIYGLTKEQFNELDAGYCPICLREWSASVIPCVDHDHRTNSVRGIVCSYCNRYQIGRLREPDLVYRIFSYLSKASVLNYPMPPKKRRTKRKLGVKRKTKI